MAHLFGRSAILSLVLAAGLLAACGGGETPVPATRGKVEVYAMRGVIEQLPTAAAPRQIMIRHEAAKEMESMTMPFTLAPGVSVTGLAVGDKVSFRDEVDLGARTEWVTQIEKLPADTVLNFGAMTMPGN